ncbi:bifunctional methylenetetrahydrofolate dehydrogenase/methenyltetrahydrofolate cyclohydrolase FolD [Candidatus Sulfidibacterium hydrothermale]|uniref:bifunctional methylenetetrahydrofolate dehydrogenase/methenyltetrahydrofolate cyclohydrolase FolD n=1 Tax=Candidatus Sulfidibacterium hydrothermale TaxID=2875962 RepID=UPI001F0A84C2|nr:bifunctional methylenetetrahydrofolate dehydrogenase/methenyltetrahydrofolate cyclohydrolase FolD [Candidatus Sulfidibacterium hydrothermale]UBM63113.1 bifunctional methylenetetrahydrofolate dehydrogenase/methenyltetrahydrofolate cyclohydrolase FolD [Candidatus Sulfidibacterium hydrothermale]
MAKKKQTVIIDGRQVAADVKESIKKEVAQIIDRGEDGPHLAAVLVGNDPASETYVASKEKAAHAVGMMSSTYRYPADITEKELLEVIDYLNNDEEIDGFIVQLPLPPHIDEDKIIRHIHPAKDVDGFTPENVGKMVLGQPAFLSATPAGIMELLKYYKIPVAGKHVVVLGRSNIVGRPMSILLSQKSEDANATVTLCHSGTKNLEEITRSADILIVAIGKPQFVTADMVKEGAVVIDVGIHRLQDATAKKGYRLVGDVDFNEVAKKASFITPVPGGVGPMTIAMLLKNTLLAHKKEIYS